MSFGVWRAVSLFRLCTGWVFSEMIACIPHVVPDWHEVSKLILPGGLPSHLAAWDARVERFLKAQSASAQKLPQLKREKITNGVHLQALDKALQTGLQISLHSLLPNTVLRPLESYEERFAVDLSDLSEEILAVSGGRSRRAAVEDTRSESTRLEVVIDDSAKWIVNVVDQGSCEWYGRCYLNYTLNLCFQEVRDISHRRDNNVKMALTRAKLNPLKFQSIIALNLLGGPWGESGNMGRFAGCLSAYRDRASIREPLFQQMYEDLALDKELGVVVWNMGTEEHMQATLDWLFRLPVWTHKQETIKTGRWHNYTQRVQRVRTEGAALLFVGILVALHEGIITTSRFTSVDDLELGLLPERSWKASQPTKPPFGVKDLNRKKNIQCVLSL
eukprot:3242238-Amphidinium_carterae.2